jgi:hypothetical protein
MYGDMVESGEETEYFDEERYVKERQQYLEEQGLKQTNRRTTHKDARAYKELSNPEVMRPQMVQ